MCLCDFILATFLRTKGGGHGRHHAYNSMLASQRTYLGTHLKVFEKYFESLEKVFKNVLNDFVVFCLLF